MYNIILKEFFSKDNGEKWLYEQLSSLKKDVFPDSFRINILYDYDEYENNEFGIALGCLCKLISELDIPLFFISLHTNNPTIHKDFKQASSLNSYHEADSVRVIPCSKEWNHKVLTKDSYCVLPDIHFFINPQGKIGPCCVFNEQVPLGHVNDINVKDIPNMDSFKNLRRQLKNGERPPICNYCWKREDIGVLSNRQKVNTTKKAEPEFTLKHLDIRLSNVCNLMCRMCSGKFSNRLAIEHKKIYGHSMYLGNHIRDDKKDELYDYIEENASTLESVYFAGGEPLINEEHYRILQILIDNKSSASISYNTNFTVLEHKKERVVDYWKHFDQVNIGASIDLIGEQASYVRYGSDYNAIEHNFNAVKDYDNIQFRITSILHLMNVFNLPKLQKHWYDKIDIKDITFEILSEPDEMRISVLPVEYKKRACETISDHINWLTGLNNSSVLVDKWTNALNLLNTEDNSHLLKKFFEKNVILDQHRNQRFEDYFPEFKDLRKFI